MISWIWEQKKKYTNWTSSKLKTVSKGHYQESENSPQNRRKYKSYIWWYPRKNFEMVFLI